MCVVLVNPVFHACLESIKNAFSKAQKCVKVIPSRFLTRKTLQWPSLRVVNPWESSSESNLSVKHESPQYGCDIADMVLNSNSFIHSVKFSILCHHGASSCAKSRIKWLVSWCGSCVYVQVTFTHDTNTGRELIVMDFVHLKLNS